MVRAITVLAPAAILAVWGISYVWSCVLVLSAPGKPVSFTYATKGGSLRFEATSYSIDWNRGTGRLERPVIYDPNGDEILAAEHVDVSGISLPTLSSVVVHVRDVTGRLTRLKSGQFDIQRFLPENKPTAGKTSFAVLVNRADVTIVDLAGQTRFQQLAIARDIDVRGVGDEWIGSCALELPGAGSLRAEIFNLPNEGLLIRGTTAGLQLGPILDHLRTTPEGLKVAFLKDFHAGSLEAFGPVSLFLPSKQALEVQTHIKAIGKDLRYLTYAADQAFFDGDINESGAQGQFDATSGGTKAKLTGSVVWADRVALGGQLHVDSPSSGSLPPFLRRMVPTQVTYRDAHMDGWIEYRERSGLTIQGPITAHQAIIFDQPVEQPKIVLTAASDQVRIGVDDGRWAGTRVHGAFIIGVKSPTLTGALSADTVDLAVVAKRFGTRGLSGRAQVSVLLGGTRSSPTAIVQASGSGSYTASGKQITGRFQAAGNYGSDRLIVDRLRVGTDSGSARAIGVVSIKKKTLSLKVDATNVNLEKLRKDLTGTLTASGIVNGTFSDPRFKGQGLALDVRAADQQIPFASADIFADKAHIAATDLRVVKGTGEANGAVALNFKTRQLKGSMSAQNVLLNEYFGDQAIGSVTVPELTIGGTLDKPLLAGTAHGSDLVLGGIQVDRADLASTLIGTVAHLDNLTAKVGDGTLTASGEYDYDKKVGTFKINSDNIALDRITPPGKGSANVTGILSGEALASISPSGIWRGKADGTLRNVNLNDTDFGSGTWSLGYDGEDLTGNASVGKLDRFLLLENIDYNTSSEAIKAQVSVLNGSLQDLYTSTRPFFPDVSFETKQKLDTVLGDLDTTVSFSGPIRNPDFDVKFLEARNLSLQNEALGSLKAVLNKSGTVWNIDSFDWAGPEGHLLLHKSIIDTAGNLNVDADLSNFDLKYVGLVDPNWARLTGLASLSVLGTGRTASPEIRASLQSAEGSSFAIESSGESFRLNLDTISVRQALYADDGSYTGGVTATGLFFYRGFTGNVTAHIPLNYPFEIPDGPQITAALNIPNVDVKELAQYATALDTARSVGSLQGTIALTGPRSNLSLQGSILGQADTLAFNDIQTTLKATVATVLLKDNQIVLTFKSTGSAGGSVSADMTASIPDLQGTLDKVAKGDTQALTRTPIQGTVKAKDFAVRQATKSKEFGTYHATINSALAITGPAITPLIQGRVGITDTNILLPSEFKGAGASAEMAFNPRFDVPVVLDEVARFRTSTADVSLAGGGHLTGTLARPNFDGTVTVQSGRINLPTARVTLEEGGTMRPSYSVSSNGDTNARVDVNLQGNTALTTMKLSDTVQRYQIRLFITGDLLSDNGLNLTATSDPPDLNKDEILTLLGQADVLKSLGSGSGATQSEAEARIRSALVSIAIPQLTDSFTSQIATNLGLEYLNIDYNAFEGASIDFAKILGKGLVLQGRRQISPTILNRKLDYDLRLTYRLPTRNAALSRVVFSLGLDQDRPYKLGIEYGFRF